MPFWPAVYCTLGKLGESPLQIRLLLSNLWLLQGLTVLFGPIGGSTCFTDVQHGRHPLSTLVFRVFFVALFGKAWFLVACRSTAAC